MQYPKPVDLKSKIKLILFIILLAPASLFAQVQTENFSLGIFGGLINYQGDLNPNSFTVNRSKPAFGLIARFKFHPHLTWRTGIATGEIQAADRYNRDYLKPRNLSFNTNLKEIHTGLEISITNLETKKLAPYLYGGAAIFSFNPWTTDQQGNKVYLQPLGTEGQGLPEYPSKKKYKLTQFAFAFGGGFRYAVSDHFNIGFELNQRKTFTDYLDDVSTTYADQQVLLNGNGPKAVEMAFRGDELPGNANYPSDKEIRGTPTEKDWYYFIGLQVEVKWSGIRSLFNNLTNANARSYNTKCPRW